MLLGPHLVPCFFSHYHNAMWYPQAASSGGGGPPVFYPFDPGSVGGAAVGATGATHAGKFS